MIAQGLSEIRMDKHNINWRALVLALPKPQPTQVLGTGYRKVRRVGGTRARLSLVLRTPVRVCRFGAVA